MKESLKKKSRRQTARAVIRGGDAPGGLLAVNKLPEATSTVRRLPKVPRSQGMEKSVAYVPREA